LLVIKLVNLHNAAKHYAYAENIHYTLLTSLTPHSALQTIDALNKAAQAQLDAMNVLAQGLRDHMKLLDTPVS
jgi:hypothetical protein